MKNIVVILIFVLSSTLAFGQAEKTNRQAEEPVLMKVERPASSEEGVKTVEKAPQNAVLEATKNEIDQEGDRKPSPQLMGRITSPNNVGKKEAEKN